MKPKGLFFKSMVKSLLLLLLFAGLWSCGGGGGGGGGEANGNNNQPQNAAPVITTQPADREVAVGAAAVFTVTATGTPAPTYQWQVSTSGSPWADVSTGTGATTASYTTAAASPDDDGKQFRVKAANSEGQVESEPAKLHINTSAITHGSQINETNTGVPPGHVLTDVSSTIIVTESWISNTNGGSRILENRNFLSGAGLIVTVDGFTVQYCKFYGKSGFSTFANDGQSSLGKNINILDCEFDGNKENGSDDVAIYGSGITLKRVHVHQWPRAMWVGYGDVWVEECYMHDLIVDNSGAHIENIYVAGDANQTYIRNKLISNRVSINGGTGGISASLAIYNEGYATNPPFPDLDNILVQDNYFESDGGFAMYGGACVTKPNPYAKHMIVRGNIFGRGIQRKCGIYGAAAAFDPVQPGNVWENNTWGPRGLYWQTGDPEEGAEVAAPGPG